MVIDWVKARLPFAWTSPICGGHLVHCSPDGQVERQVVKSAHCRGSHDEHLTLRTVERGYVEFDGNPSKFVQGHNLAGSGDIQGLVVAAMRKALPMLGQELTDEAAAPWYGGEFDIRRVDCTESFHLGNLADVRAWLRAAGELARVRWRGRAQVEGTTLMWGKADKGGRGSDWSLKAYCKADELNAAGKGHGLHPLLPMRDELIAWVQNKLRVEAMLRAAELKRFQNGTYARATSWNENTAKMLFEHYFAKMELGTNMTLPPDIVEGLKPAVRLAYTSWLDGNDLTAILPPKTFYRYRRQVLELTSGAIDLRVPQARSNVVPLQRVLELKPASVPHFLLERPELLFRRAA